MLELRIIFANIKRKNKKHITLMLANKQKGLYYINNERAEKDNSPDLGQE